MAAPAPQQRSPYPGLRPFNREESDLFYGRDRCIKSMVETLQETRFLAVLGPSGSGKSSLVRSGLFLDLEAGRARKAGARWSFIDIRHPRQQPYRELARELLRYECEVREGIQDGLGGSGGCNAPQFNPPDHVLAERRKQLRKDPLALARWWKENRPDERTNLLLLVDQFEELFGYGEARERNDVEAFVNMLLKCRENNDPAVYIVITMRSEFLAGCTLFAGLSEQINKSLSLTPRMTRDECRQAITGPAVMADVMLEPLLVTTLLNDMNSLAQWQDESDAPAPEEGAEAAPQPEGFKQTDLIARRADQLPLMQHVLNWMWLAAAARRGSPDEPIVLKLDDYLAVGGLTGALSRHAGEVMARTGDQEATERVFRALTSQPTVVSLGSAESSGVRRPRTLDQLVAETGVGEERVRIVVEAFRGEGVSMLTPSPEIALTNDLEVDIAHESLIRQWGELRRWIREEAENGRAWQELVRDTEQEGSARAELLRGLELSDRRRWWAATRPHPGWTDRYDGKFAAVDGFMARSVGAERRRKTVRYGGTGLLAAMAATALITTMSSFASAQRAQNAEAAATAQLTSAIAQTRTAEAQSAAAAKEATAARSRATLAQRQAESAEQVRRNAEETRRRAQVAAEAATKLSAQAQAAARLANQSRLAAESSRQQADRQRVLATTVSESVMYGVVVPGLRRASSQEPSMAAADIAMVTDLIMPLRDVPGLYGYLDAEVQIERAELAAAALDTALLKSLAESFRTVSADPAQPEYLRQVSLMQHHLANARRFSLQRNHGAAEAQFAQAMSAAPQAASGGRQHHVIGRGEAQLGRAETALALGDLSRADDMAVDCKRILEERPDTFGFEADIFSVRCDIVRIATATNNQERLGRANAAAGRLLALEKDFPDALELRRAGTLLVLQFIRSVPAAEQEGLELPENLEALMTNISANFSREEEAESGENVLQLASRSKPEQEGQEGQDQALASIALVDALYEATLLTQAVAADTDPTTDLVVDELEPASRRLRFVVGELLSRETEGDPAMRATVASSLDEYSRAYLSRLELQEPGATSIRDFERYGEALHLTNDLLGRRSDINLEARKSLLERAVDIVGLAEPQLPTLRYGEIPLYKDYLEKAVRNLCANAEAALDPQQCAPLYAAQQRFEASASDVLQRLTAIPRGGRAGRENLVWADNASVALAGFDPVSCILPTAAPAAAKAETTSKRFVLSGRANNVLSNICELRRGRYNLSAAWNGQLWLFESEANRQSFQRNPTSYLPSAGGHAAEALFGEDPELRKSADRAWVGIFQNRAFIFSRQPGIIPGITAAALQTALSNYQLLTGGGPSPKPN
jgi:YHS domain-containing protein